MIYLQLLIVFFLAFIFYQDLKYRAVYWICFPLLALFLLVSKYLLIGLEQTLLDAGIGLLFMGSQLLLLWGYFSIKNGKAINLSKSHLGWGDVLFLLTIVCYLSPANYIIFYVFSLILVLLYTLIFRLLNSKHNEQIPLAGLQAALLGITMLITYFTPGFNVYDDSWIYF